MAQRPCRAGASEPDIRSLNTGSPSNRGMQVHTCVPLPSIREATWQFPVMARSRVALLIGAGFLYAGRLACPSALLDKSNRSGVRHFQQPAAQLVRSRQLKSCRGRDRLAHAQADAAEAVHDFEGILVGSVVAGKYGNAVAKRR